MCLGRCFSDREVYLDQPLGIIYPLEVQSQRLLPCQLSQTPWHESGLKRVPKGILKNTGETLGTKGSRLCAVLDNHRLLKLMKKLEPLQQTLISLKTPC